MTTSARQEPTRAAGAGSAVRFSGPEGISSTELWIRRIIARLIDLVPVAVLFAGLWISGSDVLSTKPDACDPAPAPNCNVAAQTDRVDDAGNVIIEYTMLDDRVIDSGHATYQVFDTVYIADPPEAPTYLVSLIYVIVVFVVLQGVTGWTPGKLIAGIRLADRARRSPGIARAFVRWALPDGAIGIVGVVLGVAGGPWPLRVLSVFAALGLIRFLGTILPVLGPISDESLGVQFVATADYIGGRPERDDEFDLREQPGTPIAPSAAPSTPAVEATRPPMQPAPSGAARTAGPAEDAGRTPGPTPTPTPTQTPAPTGPTTGAAPGGPQGGAPTLPIIGTPGVGRPSGSPPVFPGVPDAGTPAAREPLAPRLSAVPDLPEPIPSVFERPGATRPATPTGGPDDAAEPATGIEHASTGAAATGGAETDERSEATPGVNAGTEPPTGSDGPQPTG
ncbi:MAG: RDD family protein, partial [Acidimicrobiales bacterium]|nr:RDD family protein [Acidimicrobiales bacterium]